MCVCVCAHVCEYVRVCVCDCLCVRMYVCDITFSNILGGMISRKGNNEITNSPSILTILLFFHSFRCCLL